MPEQMRFAAILVDFENVYYYLRNHTQTGDAHDIAVSLVRRLREHLEQAYQEQAISLDAYADFERIDEEVQGPLYLAGVETHNVLGTEHKNAADMRLCIDALEILYTRQQIQTFVVVAGDRDYIPLIQHLKQHGRTVRVAGFPRSVSGDLRTIVGDDYFIDAYRLLDGVLLPAESQPAPRTTTVAVPSPALPATPAAPVAPEQHQLLALSIMLTQFRSKPEIWMSPYLHRLRATLPELDEPERRALIRGLEEKGMIRVERRAGNSSTGEEIEFSVIIVNWNHPEVRSLHPGR